MFRMSLRCLVGLSLVAAAAGAQTPESTLSTRINGQALIRVSGRWGSRLLVQPRLSGGALTYAATEPADSLASPLRLDSVERIQVRGSAAGTGALIGAIGGLVGGMALSIGVTSTLCNDGGCSNQAGGTAGIAIVSTMGGALLGALIGSVSRKWQTIYSTNPDEQRGLP